MQSLWTLDGVSRVGHELSWAQTSSWKKSGQMQAGAQDANDAISSKAKDRASPNERGERIIAFLGIFRWPRRSCVAPALINFEFGSGFASTFSKESSHCHICSFTEQEPPDIQRKKEKLANIGENRQAIGYSIFLPIFSNFPDFLVCGWPRLLQASALLSWSECLVNMSVPLAQMVTKAWPLRCVQNHQHVGVTRKSPIR